MAEKLKACPYCGDGDPEITGDSFGRWIACTAGSDCMARGPAMRTEAEAIAAWNRRPPEGEHERALRVWLRAMETGRSEPLFVARDHTLRLLGLRPGEPA